MARGRAAVVRLARRARLDQLRTCRRTRPGQLWANKRQGNELLDQLVRASEQRGRDCEAERSCGL